MPRGFASLSPDRLREIARKGGKNIPAHKRAFSANPELAKRAARQRWERCSSISREIAKDGGDIGD